MKTACLALTAVLTALLLACEPVPDFCGDGVIYNRDCDFCRGSRAYPLCADEKAAYNPMTQGCVTVQGKEVIGTRCADETVVPSGTPCGGYTLTAAVTPEGKGRFSPPPAKTDYSAGEPLFLGAEATDPDYEFAGWGGTVSSRENGFTHYMAGSNAQVLAVAIFKPKAPGRLVTEAVPRNGGTVYRDPDKESYAAGERVAVTAIPAAGYGFYGWSGADAPAGNTAAVEMTAESRTLAAIFVPAVCALNAKASPDNGGAVYINNAPVTSGGETLNVETAAAALALADEGFRFERWEASGGAKAATPLNWRTAVTIEPGAAEATLTAFFAPDRNGTGDQLPTEMAYAVTVSSAGTGANGGGLYAEGAEVEISVGTAPSGQTFKNWTTASNGVTFADANNAVTTFTMPRNAVTVTANFETSDTGGGGGNNDVDIIMFTDTRDGKKYKSVKIGGQTWMAENLNYEVDSSWCYGNNSSNCDKYGRLYPLASAMNLYSGKWNGDNVNVNWQGVCPPEWHLPTSREWESLRDNAGGWDTAGKKLKSTSGWDENGNGTDDYGFSAMPGGSYDGEFDNIGRFGFWWYNIEGDVDLTGAAVYSPWRMYYGHDRLVEIGGEYGPYTGFSVRCVLGGGGTPTPAYTVTVSSEGSGATGSGSYAAGAEVAIYAGEPQAGQQFKNWTTASGGVTFADANSATTTFTMPANNVMVTAVFEVQSGVITHPSGVCEYRGGTACEWVSGCYEMNWNYVSVGGVCAYGSCTCEQIIQNCLETGTLYKGVTGWDSENQWGADWKCSEHGGTWVNPSDW